MQVNLAGDRLGSGAKMNLELHNYNRSTHNLSKKFRSSLASGILYPAYTNIALNGDKWEIDIDSITRTLPTQGPLFGSYKMQIDCFLTPIRLYQGVLHNNPINIGLKMADVKLPQIKLKTLNYNPNESKFNLNQVSTSNIWKYFGISGLGIPDNYFTNPEITRDVSALPLLTYYDIFKNYYANKQEDNAFVVTQNLGNIDFTWVGKDINGQGWNQVSTTDKGYGGDINNANISYTIYGHNISKNFWNIIPVEFNIVENNKTRSTHFTLAHFLSLTHEGALPYRIKMKYWTMSPTEQDPEREMLTFTITRTLPSVEMNFWINPNNMIVKLGLNLRPFPLTNIDKMREKILRQTGLGTTFHPEETNIFPYTLNSVKGNVNDLSSPLVGMCVKTYQSDIYNNWVKTETIDGQNGIREITKVDTTNGLELDALNLAQKVYNMLNRVAATGGTYEDWQEAVYTQSSIRKAETPMYMGGMSCEVMFEEIIANTAYENGPEKQALGSLGGRGKQFNKKGGHIEFKVEEPSIVMIIVSLTPRVTYSQGNKWYLTELKSIDDLHKPALDGIGYQDLLVERMAFTGTTVDAEGNIVERLSAGKTVAWIDYMTDVDECYGDFANNNEVEGAAFMVLNRNYNIVSENGKFLQVPTDITTYIDPEKYNYAFAVNQLDAQNFWTEIQFNIKARRLMSAKQIPNL